LTGTLALLKRGRRSRKKGALDLSTRSRRYGGARLEFQAGFFVSAIRAAARRFESHHGTVANGARPPIGYRDRILACRDYDAGRCRRAAAAMVSWASPGTCHPEYYFSLQDRPGLRHSYREQKPSSPKSMISPVQHMSSAPRHGHIGTPRFAADDDRNKRSDSGGPGTAVITKTKPQVKKPSFYRVLLLNDDYTPMEFVVLVLERFFNKDREAATRIMLHVHHHGIGECGIYTYEVAETKVTQVMDFARKHQHPLQCVMEKK
jgi:ATP-dependent Clp protease adaptor protein ClpS